MALVTALVLLSGSGVVDAREPTCDSSGNGGRTDVGVTRDSIELFSTGSPSSFSFERGPGLAAQALFDRINRQGGICGRKLRLRVADDSGSVDLAAAHYRTEAERSFAVAIGFGAHALDAATAAGMPVVGATRHDEGAFGRSRIWPVSPSMRSIGRVIARNAFKRGARSLSVVYDRSAPWARQARDGFAFEARRLTGDDPRASDGNGSCRSRSCGLLPGQSSYSMEARAFEGGDFAAMFVEPGTALTWMHSRPARPKHGLGAGPHLLTGDFARSCQEACEDLWVWSGFKLPSDSYLDDRSLQRYLADLHRDHPTASGSNPWTVGAYVGATTLVAALRRVGPVLTRERLVRALDELRLAESMAIGPLRWRRGDHRANRTLRAFQPLVEGATFGGWAARDIETDSR